MSRFSAGKIKFDRIQHILHATDLSWIDLQQFLRNPPDVAYTVQHNGDGTYNFAVILTEDQRSEYDHLLPQEGPEVA